MSKQSELFELCKQVYEVTGWETNSMFIDGTPRYTSDYLLEKLPNTLWVEVSGEGQQIALLALNMQGNGEAIAVYELPYDKEFRGSYSNSADTPLKALLELTISLHDSGVKL